MNLSRNLKTLLRASYLLAVFLLAGWLAASAHAGAVFTILHTFTGTNDGANPYAGLVQGRDGFLYGTTAHGGTNGYYTDDIFTGFGNVFRISTNGALTSLYSFNGTNDGGDPEAGLVQGSDGNFYGTTDGNAGPYYIGDQGPGSVFKITANGVLTTFTNYIGDQYLGNLVASLVQGNDGNFYGTTPDTIFELSTNGAVSFFSNGFNGYDGLNPVAALVQGSDGNFYGTTLLGGIGYSENRGFNTAYGTVFKISTNGVLTSLLTFGYTNAGIGPRASLVQGSDGNFYGTTSGNGGPGTEERSFGTVFKITSNGAFTSLYSFTNGEGGGPFASLVQGSDGSLYGTTLAGGTNDVGTVFKINPDGTGFSTLYTFSTPFITAHGVYTTNSDGAFPRAGLILVSNILYGTASGGGTYGYGTVFSLTLPGPQLNITPSGGSVVLSWPTNSSLTLESTLDLGPAAVWSSVSPAPVIVNGQNIVTNPMTGPQMFYRLK